MVFLKNYSWNSGISYSVPADTVGAVVEKLEERDGAVTKESFLDASRPKKSPTHNLFEWNDEKAAEKYRLVQSGRVLHNLVVEVRQDEDAEPITMKAVVNITPERLEKASFVQTVKAFTSEENREIVLDHALKELQLFEAKYKSLMELADVFQAIDEAAEKIAS